MRLAALAAACLICAAATETRAECRDTYERIAAGAAAEWPNSEPFHLPEDFTRYFVTAYNAEAAPEEPVEADTLMIVPLDSSISATWWYFGFRNGCMTFYVELNRIKGYHLIEQGHALLFPGERRIENWQDWR